MTIITCTLRHTLLGITNQGGWARHVAHMGDIGNAFAILAGNLKETDHLEGQALMVV
jgi:hypothetical protein